MSEHIEQTPQTLAAQLLQHVEKRQRDNGAEFYVFADSAPEWAEDLAHEAHGDMLPDDWRYRLIVDALHAIEENDDEDEARQQIEASIYNHELVDWLGSHGSRPEYCDEAAEEYGTPATVGIMDRLSAGQLREREEVFGIVWQYLSDKADELNDAA